MAIASSQLAFAASATTEISVTADPKKQILAQKAVLIAGKLASDHHSDGILFHGPKELNVRVDICKDSTTQGESLPPPWGSDGQVSELYLTKGCKFEEYTSKTSDGKSKSETVKVLKDTAKLGSYIPNLTETDQGLKRLHTSHVPHESKSISFESIMQKLGPEEIVVAKVACKALINAPATGYDVVSDLVVVMTRIKSDIAPGGYQRRVYFFHVRCDVLNSFEHDAYLPS